jgi:hypothetical protein
LRVAQSANVSTIIGKLTPVDLPAEGSTEALIEETRDELYQQEQNASALDFDRPEKLGFSVTGISHRLAATEGRVWSFRVRNSSHC